MGVKFTGDSGWIIGVSWLITLGRGVKIDHASTLHPVKRRFLIFCVFTLNKESLGKYYSFLFAPTQHSSQKTYS